MKSSKDQPVTEVDPTASAEKSPLIATSRNVGEPSNIATPEPSCIGISNFNADEAIPVGKVNSGFVYNSLT